jgi:hypothetical protein
MDTRYIKYSKIAKVYCLCLALKKLACLRKKLYLFSFTYCFISYPASNKEKQNSALPNNILSTLIGWFYKDVSEI